MLCSASNLYSSSDGAQLSRSPGLSSHNLLTMPSTSVIDLIQVGPVGGKIEIARKREIFQAEMDKKKSNGICLNMQLPKFKTENHSGALLFYWWARVNAARAHEASMRS